MKKQLSLITIMALVTAGTLNNVHAQSASSLIPYSDGVDAKSTSFNKYVSLDNEHTGYMLATKDGLSIIGNEDFKITTDYPVKEYEVVSDVDGKGRKDILVYLASPNGQNNVALISSEDSTVLFEKSYVHKNTDTNGATIEENSKILQMLSMNEKMYILYDYHIVCLDKDGNTIFDYVDDNNIWKMVAVDDTTIAFTCQTGKVKTMDINTGKVIWSTQVTGKIEVPTMEMGKNASVQLNAWDVYLSNTSLLVTGEDGTLIQLDKDSGEIINSVDVNLISPERLIRKMSENVTFTQGRPGIRQTGITNSNFMSYTITSLKEQLLLVSGYLGSEKQQVSSDNNSGEIVLPKLGLYDMSTSEMKTTFSIENYNLKTSNAVLSNYKDQEVLVIPTYSQKGVLKVSIYSMTGELIAQENVKAPSIKEKDEVIKITKVEDRYLIQSEGNVTFYVSNDFKTIEYVGNLSMASKIADTDTGMLVGYSESGIVNKIKKLNNGSKDDVIYEVDLPEQFIGNSNGFEAINYDKETNELLMLVNKRNANNEVDASYIVIIDSENGSILANDSVVLEKGVDDKGKAYTRYVTGEKISNFKDMNNDGHRELLIDSFIIDGKTLTLKSFFSKAVEETGLTIEVGDVNNDGVTDFILFGETQANLYYSKVSGYDISYSKSGIKNTYTKDLQNNISAVKLPDLNHDGVHDVVINAKNDAGNQYYSVIDGKTLQAKYNLMSEGVYNWGESFEFPGIDYNQDGTDDIIYNTPMNEVQILDGNSGDILEQHNIYPSYGMQSYSQPTQQESIVPFKLEVNTNKVALVEDQNGDGKKDVAYLTSNIDDSYRAFVLLNIVDSTDFKVIKSIEISRTDMEDPLLISVEGQKKVMYLSNGYMQIYDYENELVLAGFQTSVNYAKGIDEHQMVIATNENSLYGLNDRVDFELNPTSEIINGGAANFSWNSDKSGKMTISDQGTTITSTAQNQVEIKLLEGEHDLQFSYDDGHGKTTHHTIHLTVKKGHAFNYLFNGGLVLVLALAGGLLFYPKYRLNKKAGVKRG